MDAYDKIITLFKNYPEVLYGFTDIPFSDYPFQSQYKGALVFAVPYAHMLTLEAYDEQQLENLIMEVRHKGAAIQKEIEAVLQENRYAYAVPPVSQISEETLVAPFSFKYAAVHARLGWIGKNDCLITEKYGPRVRLFALLINFDFPNPAPILNSHCPETCFACVHACPYKVLTGKRWDIYTKRHEIIDYQQCNQKRSRYIKSRNRKHACGFCMVACPYGALYRRDNLQLIRPDVQWLDEIRAYREETLRDASTTDGYIYGSAQLHDFENPLDWITHCKRLERAETSGEHDFAESDQYLLVRGERILGMANCRRRLNEYMAAIGGHIGFSVRPAERGKGYGKKILALALDKYRALGFNRVLVTCVTENKGSRAAILANGGVFEGTLHDESDGAIMERYWIDLP